MSESVWLKFLTSSGLLSSGYAIPRLLLIDVEVVGVNASEVDVGD